MIAALERERASACSLFDAEVRKETLLRERVPVSAITSEGNDCVDDDDDVLIEGEAMNANWVMVSISWGSAVRRKRDDADDKEEEEEDDDDDDDDDRIPNCF